MAHAFKSSRFVALLALLVGLMTIGVTMARAETGAYWEIGLTKEIKNFTPELNASKDSFSSLLLTKVGLSKVEIDCTAVKLWAFNSLEESGRWTGRIHYEDCTTKLNGSTASACKPRSPSALNGLIETNFLSGLIKLHAPAGGGANVPLLELVGFAGAPFVTLELGATCAIGNKIDVTGKAFVKDAQGEGTVNKVTHLVEEGPLSGLLFGGNPAKIDGSAWISLRGEFEGSPWSGHPA